MSKDDKEKLENISFTAEQSNFNNMNNKKENKDNDNSGKIKKSKTLRSSVKMKKKGKNHHRSSSCDAIINSKKVKINDKVDIIDVESWKKYNLEQTADENFEEFLKMEYENENISTITTIRSSIIYFVF
jgi:ankyrin repeat protein